ncbi:MAG: translation initiation factor IF-2 [Candidatus Omnitrophica bacterium]|nr:translation initiation factor IF-2 [Candidatus Omnitrophota bacterium]
MPITKNKKEKTVKKEEVVAIKAKKPTATKDHSKAKTTTKSKKVSAAAVKKPKPAVKKAALPKAKTIQEKEPVAHAQITPSVPVAPVQRVPSAKPISSPPVPSVVHQKAPVAQEKFFVPEVKKEETPVAAAPKDDFKEVELVLPITVKDLAIKLQEKPSVIIKKLMDMRIMVGINQSLEEEVVAKLCEKYRCTLKKAAGKEEQVLRIHDEEDDASVLRMRSSIITFMGHVDHGKTSLLDAVRNSKVVDSEHGGITQHIGAYRVSLPHGEITFLDTPGHEAFTAMRARGARITDIVVLVVAADDGIMPQTEEAIDHARAAEVPIVVAINKIDKPQANLDRVKKQLAQCDLNPEDWGGKTITVGVSAKTGEGIDKLLEMILLEAQMLELKANPTRLAKGVVVEAKMSKGRGPVATLLVQNGTLHLNENIIVGNFFGKIRAMFDDRGHSVTSAKPSMPVEILGLTGIPLAGEQFFAVKDEKQAKEIVKLRVERQKQKQMRSVQRISLEDLHAQIAEGKIKELKIILKADVQGSLEAIRETLLKLNVSEIKLNIIHTGVGNINSSDIILAIASDALVLGFHVTADDRAKDLISKEGVEVRTYNIIYELANDIKAAVEGMLEPKLKKIFVGRAEVRKVFKLSKSGLVAGCFVTKGKFNRSTMVNLVRNGEVVFEGKLSSLKRFKDDVRDVSEGFECGMTFAGYDAMQEGDTVEGFGIEKILRTL